MRNHECSIERRAERPGSLVTAVPSGERSETNQSVELHTKKAAASSLFCFSTWLCVHQALSSSAYSFSLCSISEARAIERIAANENFTTENPQSLHPNKKNPQRFCMNEQGNVRETIKVQKRLLEEVNSLSTL